MADQYQAVLADLQDMASTFAREADEYQKIRPKLTPPVADTGDGRLNETTAAVMKTLEVLHAKMIALIEDHGTSVRAAHDSYQKQDIDNRELFEDLVPKTWGW
ncbi:hypothetical protein INP57_15910 [Saccharopolyspora sp. HNM0986]|uniref:DUF6317 family protein n=1 Tax=Saccharopolyspora galaxeae TaxID=2781241 RepID=UPI00190A2392|nr:DUF6317 family protein [Saccharopolyspora sp. HNM0986]MBK0868299.1 hypothetical protein [Saccharopolyspora sp. HNM0986]